MTNDFLFFYNGKGKGKGKGKSRKVVIISMEYANLRSTALKREMTILEFIALQLLFCEKDTSSV